MSISLCLQPKLAAQLVMTPQLQAAIGLLHLTHVEMAAHLRQALETNPLLEERRPEADGDGPGEPQFVRRRGRSIPDAAAEPLFEDPRHPTSLAAHLRAQLQPDELGRDEAAIFALLLDEMDDDGRLPPGAPAEVAGLAGAPLSAVLAQLRRLQAMEPTGVGARSLSECLVLQLEARPRSSPVALAIARDHLALAARRSPALLARALGAPMAVVGRALAELRALDPHPGRRVGHTSAVALVPDLFVRRQAGRWCVEINEADLPRLTIHAGYRAAAAGLRGDDQLFVRDRLRQASWLLRSLAMRRRTMVRVMRSIIGFQPRFFEAGPAYLQPLVLRQVAHDLALHESTVSRVTTNKVVHTGMGLFPLKYFFSPARPDGGVAASVVRRHIARIVAEEDPHDPRSDGQIAAMLREVDIDIARRTVAKYREMLRISPSSRRRRDA